MCEVRELNLKPRRSFYTHESPKDSTHSAPLFKSDLNLHSANEYSNASSSYGYGSSYYGETFHGEYYKRYEHDETPVKESSVTEHCTRGGKVSLTDSALDKLEMNVFKNISQELQTEESSISSLESNIKFFRTTVQEIFDNFYTNMKDFESYKKRFNEILAKNQEDSLADMEEFIKDMIHHIMSSETSVLTDSRKSIEIKDQEICCSNKGLQVTSSTADTYTKSDHGKVIEAYKNFNYATDSTTGDNSSKLKSDSENEAIFNIYLLNGSPCVQIKMHDRNLFSEINIRHLNQGDIKHHVASAENLKILAAKRLQLENYARKRQENMPDVVIPVKISYPKKNIHLNEDFSHNDNGEAKSFMSKICNYLCKKFRKTTYG